MLNENTFLLNRELVAWIIAKKIYKWQIRKAERRKDEEWKIKYEKVDGVLSRKKTDEKTGEVFIYTLIIPYTLAKIEFFGSAMTKDNKEDYIAVRYNNFQELLKTCKSVEELKERFENQIWQWRTPYLVAREIKN